MKARTGSLAIVLVILCISSVAWGSGWISPDGHNDDPEDLWELETRAYDDCNAHRNNINKLTEK